MGIKRVGIYLGYDEGDYPLAEIRLLFEAHDMDMVLLNRHEVSAAELDLIIAMGGDGTVLKTLDLYPDALVLAINFGTVGFLTAGDRSELEQLIPRVKAGDFLVSERLVLECSFPGGQVHAVNEIIVRTSNRLIFTDVFVDRTKIRTIRGDGVVVGTPTGSTAFLLATGAPIVMPDVRCMILDGINEYNFTSRALILPPEAQICLHISPETRDPHVYLTGDGRQLGELTPGQEVHIRCSPRQVRLMYFQHNYFFHNLSSKLSW